MKCQYCGIETYMPFRCNNCGQFFCGEHRLPESHNCSGNWQVGIPKEQPTMRSDTWHQSGNTVLPPARRSRFIWFSKKEIMHLLIGVLLTLAIGFSIPLYQSSLSWLYGHLDVLIVSAIIFAFSFISHEIMHKITAQRYGLWAEFRVTVFGVAITLLSVISPFKIIAPGAVMVGGMTDRKTIGKISIAGPLTNITLTMFFLLFAKIAVSYDLLIGFAFLFGVSINSFIALFNLIPFGILDGFKVFSWDKIVWAIAFSASLLLTIYSYLGFPLL